MPVVNCLSNRRKPNAGSPRARATIWPRNIALAYTRYMMYCISTYFSLFLTHRQNICTISALGLHNLPPASSSLSSSPPSARLLTHTFSSFSLHLPIHPTSRPFSFFYNQVCLFFFAESCTCNVNGPPTLLRFLAHEVSFSSLLHFTSLPVQTRIIHATAECSVE